MWYQHDLIFIWSQTNGPCDIWVLGHCKPMSWGTHRVISVTKICAILIRESFGLSHRALLGLVDFSLSFTKLCAWLQILAKSWWCTVYEEWTGFLRWWLISCQICLKKPLQFRAKDFMLLWFITQDINGELSGYRGIQSKIKFFSYRNNTTIPCSQNTLSCL